MTALPSFEEAETLALFLDREAHHHAISARAIASLEEPSLAGMGHAKSRAMAFSRAADLVHWIATHRNRLRQFDRNYR